MGKNAFAWRNRHQSAISDDFGCRLVTDICIVQDSFDKRRTRVNGLNIGK